MAKDNLSKLPLSIKLRLLLACLLGISFMVSAKQSQISPLIMPHDRVALVIGNSQYPSGSLKNPANDARLMAATLTQLGFQVEFYTDLEQTEMVRHIFDFYHHKATKSALRLVYFAGHGLQFEGRNYLLPVDANPAVPAEIPNNSFMLDELRQGLDSLKEGASIIILDTCRVKLCPFGKCRGVMSSLGLSSERRSSGTLIAYATGPGLLASDGKEAEHSLYTQILTEMMTTPGLSVEKLFRILTEEVFRRSGGQQKPEFVNGLMGDEICFKTGALGECPSR